MKTQKHIVLLIGGVVLSLVVWVFVGLIKKFTAAVRLPDGSTIYLAGISYGTNVYQHGSFLEKSLARWIPDTGVKWAGLGLEKPVPYHVTSPEGIYPSVWFCIQAASDSSLARIGSIGSRTRITPNLPIGTSTIFSSKLRVITTNEAGVTYQNRVEPGRPTGRAREYIAWLPLTVYPRDQARVRLRLESFDETSKRWLHVANFEIQNPYRTKPEIWPAARSLPVTNILDGVDVILQKAAVGQKLRYWSPELNLNGLQIENIEGQASGRFGGYGAYHVDLASAGNPLSSFLQLGIMQNGKVSSAWEVQKCIVRDRLGNFLVFPTRGAKLSGQNVLQQIGGLLATETWRGEVTIGQKGYALPKEQLMSITNLLPQSVPLPLAKELFVTNAAGVVVGAKRSQQEVEIRLVNAPKGYSLSFVEALAPDGRDRCTGEIMSDGIARFFSLRIANPEVHIGIGKRFETEFYLKPEEVN